MVQFDCATHTYTENGVKIPSVTQILQGAGLIDFSKIPVERLEAALNFGMCVHKATELYDLNNLDETSLDPKIQPYLEAWIKFIKDTDFKIEAIEEKVYSKLYRYAGTLDRRGIILKRNSIVDIKTSVDFGPATKFQLVAYQFAYNEYVERYERVNDRYAALLKPDGTYKLEKYTDAMDFNMFLSCLSVHNWKARNL